VVGTCVASWFFGNNGVGKSTAREKRKRETERNATELATRDNKREKHELFITQRAGS